MTRRNGIPSALAPVRRLLRAALILLAASPAAGIVFHSTDDPAYNTNAPSGALAGCGWEVTGRLGNYLGTAIGTNAVLSAGHLRTMTLVGTNTLFSYEGQHFTFLGHTNDPASDLMVWRVNGCFTNYARLYVDRDEANRSMVVLGRGRDRGTVVVSGELTNGWKFGTSAYTQRWGENEVSGFEDFAAAGDGLLLRASFDASGLTNECMLSNGDSGGGVFLRKGGEWRLAGVNFSIHPAYFKQSTNEMRFLATMMDCRGLYVDVNGDNSVWTYVPTHEPPMPASFYATRVSMRLDWLQSVIPDLTLPLAAPAPTVLMIR